MRKKRQLLKDSWSVKDKTITNRWCKGQQRSENASSLRDENEAALRAENAATLRDKNAATLSAENAATSMKADLLNKETEL